MGGNFLLAVPDTLYATQALQNCDLTAQVLTKLNRTALLHSKVAIILPCLGRSEKDSTGGKEQFVTTESTMLNVQRSIGILEPASQHLRSETWITATLAKKVLGERTTVAWDALAKDYDLIRDSISRVVNGCQNYNERVRHDRGFVLPNPPRQREFPTDTGKAKFVSSPLAKIEVKNDQLLMMTIRSHDQFNTTVYKESDRYRGIKGSRRIILMNESDIAARNLRAGQIVDLTSHFDDEMRRAERFIVVRYPIPPQCCATYFPETNVLVPHTSVADKSNCPTSKSVVITIAPHLHNGTPAFSG
jgi:anaerobic selenocysteine-containing dehydrogenase